jgi:hypothetical protein
MAAPLEHGAFTHDTHWNTTRRRRKFATRFPAAVPVPHVARIHKYAERFLGQEVPLETGCDNAEDTCRGKAVRNWCWDEDTSKKITGRSYIDGEGACRRHQ